MELSLSQLQDKYICEIQKEQFNQQFQDKEEINRGSFGQVYRVKHKGKYKAIKFFFNTEAQKTKKAIIKEYQIQKDLSHQNIVACQGLYQVSSLVKPKIFILMEYCEFSLAQYQFIKNLQNEQRLNMCRQIVSAIAFAHEKRYIHRDLKPANILISSKKSMLAKIADFGCSRKWESSIQMTTNVGTPLYCDPNVLKGRYTPKCDIYSLGLIIQYIFLGECILSKCKNREDLLQNWRKLQYSLQNETNMFLKQKNVQSDWKKFIFELTILTISVNYQNRISAKQLLIFLQKKEEQIKKAKINSQKLNSLVPNQNGSDFSKKQKLKQQKQTILKAPEKSEIQQFKFRKKLTKFSIRQGSQCQKQEKNTQESLLLNHSKNQQWRQPSQDNFNNSIIKKKSQNFIKYSAQPNAVEIQNNTNTNKHPKVVQNKMSIIDPQLQRFQNKSKNQNQVVSLAKMNNEELYSKSLSECSQKQTNKSILLSKTSDASWKTKKLSEHDKLFMNTLCFRKNQQKLFKRTFILKACLQNFQICMQLFNQIQIIKNAQSTKIKYKRGVLFLLSLHYLTKLYELKQASSNLLNKEQMQIVIDCFKSQLQRIRPLVKGCFEDVVLQYRYFQVPVSSHFEALLEKFNHEQIRIVKSLISQEVLLECQLFIQTYIQKAKNIGIFCDLLQNAHHIQKIN